jgi:predicted dehydrogenase
LRIRKISSDVLIQKISFAIVAELLQISVKTKLNSMVTPIRFGILGPGKIANRFCEALQTLTGDAQIYAVASRDEQKAKEFAGKFNIPKYYVSYEQMIADPQMDVVYIATPHPFHFEQAKLCLLNGKAVLCEKPMTVSLKQTSALVEIARVQKVFLMEAMWSRFIPALVKVKELLDDDAIGEIKFLHADFGFISPNDLNLRTFNKALGGGAQLDVGVYPMFLTLWLLGKPESIKAHASLATTGADDNTSALLGYKNGAAASIYSSFVSDSVKDAVIMGTKGSITIHAAWHKATAYTVKKNNEQPEYFELPYKSNGLQFQAIEVIQCLREGKTESSKLPLDMSLLMAQTADEILKQIGVSYE